MSPQTNWAGNYEYGAATVHHPRTVEQVQELVRRGSRLRALGTRHSFNSIADTTEGLISLDQLDQDITLNREDLSVTAAGGLRYGQLSKHLYQQGFALHNLASLPHISIAGACATATHGSGDNNGNLATAVSGMELVKADGEVVILDREQDGDQFQGAVVGLGAFGVVTKLTLDIVPSFEVRQDVYENLSLSELKDHFDEITSSAYSVSLFTDWKSQAFNQVWLKRNVTKDEADKVEPKLFGATPATRNLHPIVDISAESCTQQMGVPGPWHERLPHFRMDHTPSSGQELQSEYFVSREHTYEALRAISRIRGLVVPLLQISEVRTMAADTLWMSPCYQRDSVAIHFTWISNEPAVRKLLPVIEEALAPFDARPHWGKLFTMSPERVMSHYRRLGDFRQLISQYDLHGKFRNAFLETYLYGGI